MADKYDEAVAYLTAHPDEIRRAWANPDAHEYGCLFMYLDGPGGNCGCLTLVKLDPGMYKRTHPHMAGLIDRVNADPRIPKYEHSITEESLPAFAEWQRILAHERGET